MTIGVRGTPGTGRLIGINGLGGVGALSILTTDVWRAAVHGTTISAAAPADAA